MDNATVNINIQIDPKAMTAAEAAAYGAEVVAALTANLGTPAAMTVGTPAHIVGIDKQLGRLTDFAPVYAPRVKKLHHELVALGYVPTLPKSKKGQPPSYISYHDAKGKNFGNLNSKTFVVMRGDLRDELEKHPLFGANPRYAYCELESDEAVAAVVKVAAAAKK